MFYRYIPLILFIVIIPFTSPHNLNASDKRKLSIIGLKIYTEDRLYSVLDLRRYDNGEILIGDVEELIHSYYEKNGYSIVKIYTICRDKRYTLFIDEGRVDKIIVHGLNKLNTIRFKLNIDIPDRIYNTDVIKKNKDAIMKKFKYSDIRAGLLPPEDYSRNMIQLDRDFDSLQIGDIVDIKFFDEYPPRYDLHFYVSGDVSFFGNRREELGFDIHYKFPSEIIPEIFYYADNIFLKKDHLETRFMIGLDPGLDGLFNLPPENTFHVPPKLKYEELLGDYKFFPIATDIFGPLARLKIYNTETSRTDLGFESFNYLQTRATLAPEFTLLRNFNIYMGAGIEQVIIYDSKEDATAVRHMENSDNRTDRNPFLEWRIKFDPIPIRIGSRIQKYVMLTYTLYYHSVDSREIELIGEYDSEFRNHSVLAIKARGLLFQKDPPFYHSQVINSDFFKGYVGQDYYSNRQLAVSLEYRFSIYRDYLFTGVFLDMISFIPEGYILSGHHYGLVTGPTFRILTYDQFEFAFYVGYDFLFPEWKTGKNMEIRLTKKW